MSLTAGDVNYVVYRYLLESGLKYSAEMFAIETNMGASDWHQKSLNDGWLVRLLQRGLQYLELEANKTSDNRDDPFVVLTAADILTKSADELRKEVAEKRREPEDSAGSGGLAASHCRQLGFDEKEEVLQVLWSPDGRQLLARSDGPSVRLREFQSASAIAFDAFAAEHGQVGGGSVDQLLSHASAQLSALAWSPDGLRLCAAWTDGHVCQWRLGSKSSEEHTMRVDSREGHEGEGKWDKEELGRCEGHVFDVQYSESSHRVAAGCAADEDAGGGCAYIWDAESLRLLARCQHPGGVLSVSWGHAGLVTGCEDGAVRLYGDPGLLAGAGTCSMEAQKVMPGRSGKVEKVVWAENGWLVAAACDNGKTLLWNADEGSLVCDLIDDDLQAAQSHASDVVCLCFSPTGARSRNAHKRLLLATAARDWKVKVWDCQTGGLVHTLSEHTRPVHGCAWAPDGSMLATVGYDCRLRLWKAEDGGLAKAVELGSQAHDVAWHPEGRHVAVATKAGTAVISVQ